MLPQVLTGAALVVPALEERAYGDDPLSPRTRVVGKDATLRLTGQKTFVCADGADGFLVSASGPDGPALCYVPRNARGCSLTTTQTVEGRKLATLGLAQAPADLIPPHPSSRNAVEALYNLALMALSCELLGVMERAQEITLDYLRIRKQFGKLIGSFQALQHQAVNIYVCVEAIRSLVFQIAAHNEVFDIDPAMAIALKAKASEVALIGLNRPDKRNCFDLTVMKQLRAAIDRAGEEAKCGIIFGHGDNFCAGLDLRWAAESWKTGRSQRLPFQFNRNSYFEVMARGNIPFIAALHGATLGGGLETAAAAHIRVADETTYFALDRKSVV